jgi:vancomycin permeability regulator SanA
MTTKRVSIGVGAILLFCLLFWAPWIGVTIWAQQHVLEYDDFFSSYTYPAVLVFGGLVNEGEGVSEINQERILTGAELASRGVADQVVLSNTSDAADRMSEYLLENYPELKGRVVLDNQAIVTSDTCKYELSEHPEQRLVLLVSQRYHLPRILLQCRRLGVLGKGFAAEELEVIDREDLGFWTTLNIRYNRTAREAFFIWLNILGIYT